ncbi:alcohol dehydrogenase catalytic domain-containing protein [Sphingobacterium thalpophilum]|uniref:alcohol dehydrogenase catalytic domain-containing protein n=1 Tax=Sphingobacterium thalpophilum TaxID=259 RepID=UPI0031DE4A73
MKAIVLKTFGGIENLSYEDIEKPKIEADEVLIKVKALSINPVDVKVRGRQAPLAEDLVSYQPLILGWDISGEIIEKGGGRKPPSHWR